MSLNIVSWPTFLVNIAMIGNTPEYIYLLFDYYLTIDMQQSLVSKERTSEVLGKTNISKRSSRSMLVLTRSIYQFLARVCFF